MPKYNVHIFAIFRVTVEDIEANSHEKAIEATERLNWQTRDAGDAEYADEISHYLVDVVGDEDFENSKWYKPDGESELFGSVEEVPDEGV